MTETVVAVVAVLLVAALVLVVVMAARRARAGAAVRKGMDPFALGEPWRLYVRDALQAERRFADAVKHVQPGPLKERLDDIGARLHEGVEECWNVASRADAMQRAVASVDARSKEADLARLQRELGTGGNDSLERASEALRAQLASAARMEAAVWDARDRLRLLDARLDEAVARAAELSLRAGAESDLGLLGHDVDDLVGEMEALRTGLEEMGG